LDYESPEPKERSCFVSETIESHKKRVMCTWFFNSKYTKYSFQEGRLILYSRRIISCIIMTTIEHRRIDFATAAAAAAAAETAT
jgi:hypothetical protein